MRTAIGLRAPGVGTNSPIAAKTFELIAISAMAVSGRRWYRLVDSPGGSQLVTPEEQRRKFTFAGRAASRVAAPLRRLRRLRSLPVRAHDSVGEPRRIALAGPSRPHQPTGLGLVAGPLERPQLLGDERLRGGLDFTRRSRGCSMAAPSGLLVGDTPLRRSFCATARPASPRSLVLCLRRQMSSASAASSTSPTSVKRSRTALGGVVGARLRRRSADASSDRVRARCVNACRQIVRATASGSPGGRPPGPRPRAAPSTHCDQKSTGAGSTSIGAVTSSRAPTPSFSLIFFSISSARSGLSRRKLRTFSLPCPS